MIDSASRTVTYSPAFTLVPTYECFNRCDYCNFRVEPGQGSWMTLAEAEAQLRALQSRGVVEILILSGEVHPKSVQRSAWFERIYNLCELALSFGFLPNTNAGPLSYPEMARLKEVNVSMGLMLEQLTPKLLTTVHQFSPSKVPALRLEQLVWAGELQIPFTTGLLLGIGETEDDRNETLQAIADLHGQWGHIQEVILQPHRPGKTQLRDGFSIEMSQFIETIATARQILPLSITLQIPPNLVPEAELMNCLEAGVRDLGGIGPVDEVNPDYPHLRSATLKEMLRTSGWSFAPRLPVYPQYDSWLPPRLRATVQRWRNFLTDS
ncbi:MAG: 7,8-didemethyl-8-hydroxy-5-deazariboflavin synthase subunit CofG [Leptolyngbyaceae cyanobacterium bins.59]|nr:7,8-didemethyl-8-hydroxy-5-deazariboflavin synthase subunit CofG [Leptolyngbyaceae cyanobacterium bins.59]